MLDVVKPDDLQAIIVRLVLAAQQGDIAAARLVLAYTLGKPAPVVDPDALDLAEWQHWQQMPVPNEALAGLLGPLQVPLACLLARTILPLLQATVSRELQQQLDPAAPPSLDQAQPKPACPLSEGGAVPVAGFEGSARLPAPTPPCPPTAPAGQPTRKEPPRKREATSKPRSAAGRAPEPVSGLAAGGPTEGPANPNAELQRWLEVCARLLGPDPFGGESLAFSGNDFAQQPLFQGCGRSPKEEQMLANEGHFTVT